MTDQHDYLKRARATTPGGVHSSVRQSGPKVLIERALGARMWDVDGKEYVDHLLGQGPNFFGHAPPIIAHAVQDAIRSGIIFGGQHPLELEAGERMLGVLEWPDLIRSSMTGTEVAQAAIRLARDHTGRQKILRFEGQYHGWLDNVLIWPRADGQDSASAGQLALGLGESIVIPWNEEESVRREFERARGQIAAIIAEPAMINSGAIPSRTGFLEALRSLTKEHGALLIFDEVITGFRLAAGGGVERFGVTPDLATYGKAMAGGVPAAAFAGRADVMERLAGDTNHSGTLNGNALSSAEVIAAMDLIEGSPPCQGIEDYGTALMAGIERIASEHGQEMNVQGFPMAFDVSFGKAEVTDWRTLQNLDLDQYARLSSALVESGTWVTGRGVWYSSAAHGSEELADVLDRFEAALSAWPTT